MRTLCIVNPIAGKGRALQVWKQFSGKLKQLYGELDMVPTRCAGDATTLARQGVEEGYELVVAFGGDGTLHEVVNGMVGGSTALGVVPAGTGNDFARSLGIGKDLNRAFQVLSDGHMKRIDLGTFDGHYFLNMGGLGLDASVAHRINSKRILRGQLAYLVAVLQTLAAYDSYPLEICIDEQVINQEAIIVSVGNGQYVGGGFRLLPQASLEDGLLDIMIVGYVGRGEIIKTLPALYKGTHVGHPKCSFYRGRDVKISLKDPTKKVFAQIDGQEYCQFPLVFGVLPKALQVLAPISV